MYFVIPNSSLVKQDDLLVYSCLERTCTIHQDNRAISGSKLVLVSQSKTWGKRAEQSPILLNLYWNGETRTLASTIYGSQAYHSRDGDSRFINNSNLFLCFLISAFSKAGIFCFYVGTIFSWARSKYDQCVMFTMCVSFIQNTFAYTSNYISVNYTVPSRNLLRVMTLVT